MVNWLHSLLPGVFKAEPVVPVIRMSGTIGRGSRFRPGLTLASVAGPLKKAFDNKKAEAVAIIIDSPGGSPVQSHMIYKRIRALAEEKQKRVFIFVEDVCASGGYMIACAGDEIIVDPASIVGSIGVVSAGFGFVDAIHKLGIERRVYTSGESKVILDPFQPEKPEDVRRLKVIQEEVHELFIDLVKKRRGSVLADDPEIFSGLFWSGKTAVSLGLADRLGDMRHVLREKYGDKVRLKLIGAEKSFFGMRPGRVGAGLAAAAGEGFLDTLEERSLRQRFGG
ncbi:S49 family peptidase [Afifella sp. H1R]|uniref:S49 family peptidase n=1 Tax=Afifella sp. H1R TaxID=2908841 RepID=UPI001F1D5770|nr:S49 family peptidase [Afifella sp. H1R]MCF1504452.1 S49 family peptidase [Afifella sp. H1R]